MPDAKQDWQAQVQEFAETLSDPLEIGAILSLREQKWESRKQLLEYLQDRLAIAKREQQFHTKWCDQLGSTQRLSFIQADVNVTTQLIAYLQG